MKVRVAAEEPDHTKEFADACWRDNPRISPDSWRLNGDWTSGKLWLDGTQGVPTTWPVLHSRGINGVICAPATLAAWQAALAGERRPACVLGLVVDNVATLPTGVDFVLWQGAEADQADGVLATGLRQLEQAVAAGQLAGYGFWVEHVAALDWAAVAQAAKTAAAEAWGRRKRAGWRMLAVPLGLTERAALTQPVWDMDGERVSLLEGAARQEMLVLVQPPVTVPPPAAAVIAAVEQVARQEAVLVEQLGGWPQRGGAEVFSVLRHLQLGMPLWPGEPAWRYFMTETLPALTDAWGQVTGAPGEIAAYLQALAAMAAAAYASGLVAWGAAQLLERGIDPLRAVVGLPWAELGAAELPAALLASVPGVTGVLGAWTPVQVDRLMTTSSLPDVGVFLIKETRGDARLGIDGLKARG